MSDNPGPPNKPESKTPMPDETWIKDSRDEAEILYHRLYEDFEKGLTEKGTKHMPIDNPANRSKLLNIFLDALIRATVCSIATFGHSGEQMETAVINGIKHHFNFIRAAETAKKKAKEASADAQGK